MCRAILQRHVGGEDFLRWGRLCRDVSKGRAKEAVSARPGGRKIREAGGREGETRRKTEIRKEGSPNCGSLAGHQGRAALH